MAGKDFRRDGIAGAVLQPKGVRAEREKDARGQRRAA